MFLFIIFFSNGIEVQEEYGLASSMNLEVVLSGQMDKEFWHILILLGFLFGNPGKQLLKP